MFNEREKHFPLCYGGFMSQPGKFGCQMGQDMKCDHWCECMSRTRENMAEFNDYVKGIPFMNVLTDLRDITESIADILSETKG